MNHFLDMFGTLQVFLAQGFNFTSTDFLGIAPVILAVLGALSVITLDIFLSRGDDREIMPISTAGVIVGVAVMLLALWRQESSLFGGQLVIDRFGILAALTCTFAAGVTVLTSPRYLQRRNMEFGEYYGLILFALCGMILMCMGRNLMTVFLALEVMSLAIYGLVGMTKTDPEGAEAATKYFVLGAFGSGFFTFGIAMVYGATGTTDIQGIADALQKVPLAKYILLPGFGMMVIGFCFKLGAAPFHGWVPDVYQGAPTPITGFMAAGVKVAAAAVFGRLLFQGLEVEQVKDAVLPVLVGLSALSLFIGGFTALIQRNLKRLLGFSAVAHTGFLLMAFLGSSGSNAATSPTSSLIVYLIGYSVTVIGPFAILSLLSKGDDDLVKFDQLNGLAKKRPALAAAMGLFMLSLAGIPGTVGFLSKFVVIQQALAGHHYLLVVLGIVVSLVSLGYYLPVIVAMYMREPCQEFERDESLWGPRLGVTVTAIAVLAMGLVPQMLFTAANSAAATIR